MHGLLPTNKLENRRKILCKTKLFIYTMDNMLCSACGESCQTKTLKKYYPPILKKTASGTFPSHSKHAVKSKREKCDPLSPIDPGPHL